MRFYKCLTNINCIVNDIEKCFDSNGTSRQSATWLEILITVLNLSNYANVFGLKTEIKASKWKCMRCLSMTDNELTSGPINCTVGNNFWTEDVDLSALSFRHARPLMFLIFAPFRSLDWMNKCCKNGSQSLRRRLNVISQLIMLFFLHAFTVSTVSESLADSQNLSTKLPYNATTNKSWNILCTLWGVLWNGFLLFSSFFLPLLLSSMLDADEAESRQRQKFIITQTPTPRRFPWS